MIILKKVEGSGASVLLRRCETNAEVQKVLAGDPAFYITSETEWQHAAREMALSPNRTEIRRWFSRVQQEVS